MKNKKQNPKKVFPPLSISKSQLQSFPDLAVELANLLGNKPGGKKMPNITKVAGQIDLQSLLSGK